MIAVEPIGVESAQSKEVRQIWKGKAVVCTQWQQGAIDAFCCRRPRFSSVSYMAGYSAQLVALPADEAGCIEWWRYSPDGGW